VVLSSSVSIPMRCRNPPARVASKCWPPMV
jgi:hypothetical protein